VKRPLRAILRCAAWGLAGQTALNARLLRTPPPARLMGEPVSMLLPVRDERDRVEPCLRALLAQTHVPSLSVLVLDDGSTDGTAELVQAIAGDDPRVRLLTGTSLPAGWLGKPWACQQLADQAAVPVSGGLTGLTAASGTLVGPAVLAFVDADVVLAPDAVARAVGLLRDAGLAFVSPYPRQVAVSAAERLVQPLLQWSWLCLLPLRIAERTPRLSMAVANGQLLVVDAAAYRASGGHGAAPGAVLEDVALARTLRAEGGRGGMADGTGLATCRMYRGWSELRDGYAKSLWSAAGGSLPGSLAQVALLGALWLRPDPVTLAAGVVSRAIAARRTGSQVLPDALAHSASVAVWAALTALSWSRHRRGALTWKGRPVG